MLWDDGHAAKPALCVKNDFLQHQPRLQGVLVFLQFDRSSRPNHDGLYQHSPSVFRFLVPGRRSSSCRSLAALDNIAHHIKPGSNPCVLRIQVLELQIYIDVSFDQRSSPGWIIMFHRQEASRCIVVHNAAKKSDFATYGLRGER